VERTPGQVLHEARRRHGVSQAQLATRAGTTQSAISRIERDHVSPSVETLASLLYLLGEDLELEVTGRDSGVDRTMIRERLKLAPGGRVDYGTAFADALIQGRRTPRESAA
jgi:transcriptional regulator with XRE-family HTH domain